MSSDSSRGKPVDIIDLDRYMRVSVSSRPTRQVQRCGDLVVDAGGVERLPTVRSSSGDSSYTRPSPVRAPAHHKRFSNDSGVSDGSYVKRRHRNYKHYNESNQSRERSRRNESSSAMTEFRVSCEQALLEQQKQISRLAEVCERLVQPSADRQSGLNVPQSQNKNKNKENSTAKKINNKQKQVVVTTDSSDLSSSSNSRDVRHKEHRSDSCKTYKIMLDRLDDLSRVIANRRSPNVGPCASSVIVCNKIVATEPQTGKINNPTVRNVIESERKEECETSNFGRRGERRVLDITRARTLDIAPALIEQANIVTERVVRRSSSSGDLRSQLYLEDPIRFYAQAKRLQALQVTTQCQESPNTAAKTSSRDVSLCALCRIYWRALRDRILQTFGT